MHTSRILFAALILVATLGCGAEDPATESSANRPLEVTPEIEARLASADQVDGSNDHVVSMCPSCALAMEGSDEFPVQVGEYELHFCSEGCKERFEEDKETMLMALAVPEPTE